MNLDFLYYFKKLAELQNYNKAAEELYISQPNLSYAITSLEKELGFKLFIKKGRGTVITEKGKKYLEYVNIALSQLEKAKQELTNPIEDNKRHFILATSRVFFIKDILNGFRERYSSREFSISIHQSSTENSINDLLNKRIDGMFCGYKGCEKIIEYIPIIRQKWFIFVPEEHTLASFDNISLKAIEKFPLVIPKKDPEQIKAIEHICMKYDFNPNIFFETFTNASAIRMVINHTVPGFIHYFPDSENSPVKKLTIQEKLDGFHMYFACLKNRRASEPINCLRDYIYNLYKNDIMFDYPS